MSIAITSHSAATLAKLISERKISPVEVMEAYLARIDKVNPELNAIVTLAPDALDQARDAEAAIMRGEDLGQLHGVPVTVKDTIDTEGLRTTSGSLVRKAHIPKSDAPAVAKLKAAGAIVIGKTNVPEMAIPYECDNPIFGRTNNPYDLDRTSGGSSGGEAAAIAACLSPAGLGSDLSGSIRVPAHFCGIAGLKPTPGLVPSAGHFPSVTGALMEGAVLGPMARTIEDLLLVFNVLSNTSSDTPSEISVAAMQGQRIATYFNHEYFSFDGENKKSIGAGLQALKDAGAVTVADQPPGLERAADLWNELFSQPSALGIRDAYKEHDEAAGPNVLRVLDSIYNRPRDSEGKASSERDELRAELLRWMTRTPLIITPVGCVSAFEHGARRVEFNGGRMSIFRAFAGTRIANVLGLPAVVLRAGTTEGGLPLGVQIMGRPNEEGLVLTAAAIIERSVGGWIPSPLLTVYDVG